MKIKIWDRKEDLKGISKDVWFESYPESIEKTLVLVDDTEVLFLEDIDCKNEEEVETYLNNRKIESDKYVEIEENKKDEFKNELKNEILESVIKLIAGTPTKKIELDDIPEVPEDLKNL